MPDIRQCDLQAGLDALKAIGSAAASVDGFGECGVAALRRVVPSELTTLSICDLESGRRRVVSDVPDALSQREIDAFDRHFDEHPLLREHRGNLQAETRQITDLVPMAAFSSTALFDEYYRPIGIDHVMALPVHVDRSLLVSFVFNRSRRPFEDRERASLEAIRPHLGHLYRLASAIDGARPCQWAPPPRLTAREREVLRWLAAGKTDRDIGEILAISPRTVHKHLQRIYEKLGVECRTAAVVRAMNLRM